MKTMLLAALLLAVAGCDEMKKVDASSLAVAKLPLAPESGRAMRPALLSMTADARHDLEVCIAVDAHRHCYPNEGSREAVACRHVADCDVRVAVPTSGEFDVELWDSHGSARVPFARGQCTFGERCHLGASTVVVSEAALPRE